MKKADKLRLILEIVKHQQIETQQALVEALQARGVQTTQASLSRYLNELSLEKGYTDGHRYYQVTAPSEPRGETWAHQTLWKELKTQIRRAQVAGNLVVLHTAPAMAQPVAASLDSLARPEIVGTLAGDDTVFLAAASPENAKQLCEELGWLISGEGHA